MNGHEAGWLVRAKGTCVQVAWLEPLWLLWGCHQCALPGGKLLWGPDPGEESLVASVPVEAGGLLPASTATPLFCHSLSSWKYPLQGMVLQTNLYSYHFNKNVKSIYIHLRWVQLGGQTLNSWFVSFI